jgi:hypothetical protein
MAKFAKGTGAVSAKYAQGGASISTRSRFMKAPNPFTDDNEKTDFKKSGKGGTLSKTEGDTKKLTAIKPRT